MDGQTEGVRVVQEVLQLIARFQTPATPEIYEVWYRYSQRENEALVEALDVAIDQGRTIDGDYLHSLHEQHCVKVNESIADVQTTLTCELVSLQLVVNRQKDAGGTYTDTLSDAVKSISDGLSSEELAECIGELLAATAEMKSELQQSALALDGMTTTVRDLRQLLAESQRAMMIDPLTGIGNRRYFDTVLRQLLRAPEASERDVFLALLDMDKLKSVNDSFGHEVGDLVIKHVATRLKALIPEAEHARLGGDEFAVFLRSEGSHQAEEMVERIRSAMASEKLTMVESGDLIGVATISVGLAALRPTDDEKSLYERADKLLYEAKGLGGNRVVAERRGA